MAEKIERVAVVGLGILGSQIAIQAACYGYEVAGFDGIPDAFDRANQFVFASIEAQQMFPVMGLTAWREGLDRVKISDDLEEAVSRADLVIEVVPERLELKRDLFGKLDALAPARAILASNSSSIPVSRIESAVARPGQCMNLHFYFPALGMNLVDVMAGGRPDAGVVEACLEWVRSIGCIPIHLRQETFGFCLNRMQHAARREALHMWAEGAVDLADMDRAWMVWTKMPFGFFGMMDQVGLDVVYNVEMNYYEETKDPRFLPPEALKAMIDRGELGAKSGKGFYDYPDPDYKQPWFLTGKKPD